MFNLKPEKNFYKILMLSMYLVMAAIMIYLGIQGLLHTDKNENLSIPLLFLYSLAIIPLILITIRQILCKTEVSFTDNSKNLFLYGLLFIPIPSVFIVYFGLFSLFALIPHLFKKRFIIENWKKEYWLNILFVIFALVSAILSQFKGPAFSSIPIFLIYLIILMYFSSALKPQPDSGRITTVIAHGIILWALFAILHYFLNKNLDLIFMNKISDTFIARQHNFILISIFTYTSMTSWLFALGILIIVNTLLKDFKKITLLNKLLYVAAIGLALALIILSRGRAAFIILFMGLGSMVIFYKKWVLIIALVVLSGSVFIIPNPKMKKTLTYITRPQHIPNMQSRLDQYKEAKELREKHGQIWGIGLMNFTQYYQKEKPIQYKTAPVEFIHGLYISILTETGIMGFISFFLFFLVLLFLLIFKTPKDNEYRILGISFLFALFGISLVDSILYNVQVGVVFWIILGLAFNSNFKNNAIKEQ